VSIKFIKKKACKKSSIWIIYTHFRKTGEFNILG